MTSSIPTTRLIGMSIDLLPWKIHWIIQWNQSKYLNIIQYCLTLLTWLIIIHSTQSPFWGTKQVKLALLVFNGSWDF